jgi:DNA polymerase V
MVLTVGYDIENLNDPERMAKYRGEVKADFYGRMSPKPAHGSINLGGFTSSTRRITAAMMELFDRIVDPALLVRRINIAALNVTYRGQGASEPAQLDLFSDLAAQERESRELEREMSRQRAVLQIRKKYGKNAILRGMNFLEGATARQRNAQIGGHKA